MCLCMHIAYACVGFDVSSFCFHMMLDACVCVGIGFHSMSSLWSLYFFYQFIYWYSYIHSGAFNIAFFLLAHIIPIPKQQISFKKIGREKDCFSFLLEISFVFHNLLTITLVYGKHERDVDVILWQFFPGKEQKKSIWWSIAHAIHRRSVLNRTWGRKQHWRPPLVFSTASEPTNTDWTSAFPHNALLMPTHGSPCR